jgi:hypothetical protein
LALTLAEVNGKDEDVLFEKPGRKKLIFYSLILHFYEFFKIKLRKYKVNYDSKKRCIFLTNIQIRQLPLPMQRSFGRSAAPLPLCGFHIDSGNRGLQTGKV